MRRFSQHLISLLFAAALIFPAILTGCAARVGYGYGYRVRDRGYGDYHTWDADEDGYYRHWEGDTHRGHEDFRKRSGKEQKEYFDWRHNHHD